MATLWEQLNRLYPEILSSDPHAAINGTKLLEKVRGRLDGQYAENTIRQHFSVMSQDATSAIAKIADGHGYYLRKSESRSGERSTNSGNRQDLENLLAGILS
ncbi:MAG: hypothetical protein ABI693_31250 [Bryobacteraceae bacterium]